MIYKTLLPITLLSVISATANANILGSDQSSTFCKSGFYTGIQGGRSDTFYSTHKVLAQAASHGRVGSMQKIDYNIDGTPNAIFNTTYTLSPLSHQHLDDIGIGGRIYAGYQFNPYFALEAGYTQYGKTSFSATGTQNSIQTSISNEFGTFYPGNTTTTTSTTHYFGEITERAIDLDAKATLPLRYGFGLYVKAGVAYISADRHINSNEGSSTQNVYEPQGLSLDPPFALFSSTSSTNGINEQQTIYNKSYQSFRPVAGLGMNYTIPNTAMSVDASYTRVFSSSAIPNASLLALGIEYKFI